tara:strand:- start:423 stop:767 length:345 start_codon:yes stop_codon:yes gene_type:complete
MARVSIAQNLKEEILKKFKKESKIIFRQMYSLGDNPIKGKPLGNIGRILIKELKYKSSRFYFILEGDKLKIMDKSLLTELLIKFVRMSNKKHQQKTINEIKNILIKLGPEGFSL